MRAENDRRSGQAVLRPVAWTREAQDEGPIEGVLRRRTPLPPDPKRWDPFILLGEDWFDAPGFDWHPHRGFETVTYLIDGHLEHADSWGNTGTIGPGDAQWMTAGSGVLHQELARPGKTVHGLQLWLNLPRALKGTTPSHQDLRGRLMPTIKEAGYEVRVFAGRVGGIEGAARLQRPATMADVRGGDGTPLLLDVETAHACIVYAVRGGGVVNGTQLNAGNLAFLAPGEGQLEFQAEAGALFVLYGAAPIGEPTVVDGPFVMNSREEIAQAYADVEAGRFGRPTDQKGRNHPGYKRRVDIGPT